MKKKTILIIVGVIGSIVFFASGFLAGSGLLDFQDKVIDEDKVNNVDDENKIEDENNIDASNEDIQLALGRYLYFLAHDVKFDCSSPYIEREFVEKDGKTKIIIKNYDELINSFTENYILNEKYLPPIFHDECIVKDGDTVYTNCYCGSGSLAAASSYLSKFEVSSANETEISYSVVVDVYDYQTGKLANSSNDSFKIKKVNNKWKIDEYTWRNITNK